MHAKISQFGFYHWTALHAQMLGVAVEDTMLHFHIEKYQPREEEKNPMAT